MISRNLDVFTTLCKVEFIRSAAVSQNRKIVNFQPKICHKKRTFSGNNSASISSSEIVKKLTDGWGNSVK